MAKIEKIYSIVLEGEQDLVSKMKIVNSEFDKTKKNFTEIKNASKGIFNSDKEIENYRKSLENLNKELLKNQTISKILKSDNEAYLRVSQALNQVEKERSSNINITAESFKKANVEAKNYYSSKFSGKGNTNPFQNYQSNINQNFSDIKSNGNIVNFAAGYISEQKKIEAAQERLNFETSDYGKELAKVNIQTTQAKKANKEAAIDALGLADAYAKLSKKQRESFDIAKNVGVEKGIYSREFQKAAGEANYYDQQLKKIDFALGRFSRNVGNYNGGMFGLNNSMAQIMREMPAFTNSAQTGFMAISNNLPILADAIQAVKVRNAELKQEFIESATAARKMATEEALAAGASLELASAKGAEAEAMVMANYAAQKSPSVIRQLMGAIFSWQSLLAIGITLLTVYGKDIVEWTKKMIKGGEVIESLAEKQKILNDTRKEGLKDASREISQLETLYRVATNEALSREQRLKATNKLQELYPSYFKNMTDEQIMLGKSINQYKNLKEAILASAQASAIEKKLAERADKDLEQEQELYDKIGQRKIEIANKKKTGKDIVFKGSRIEKTPDVVISNADYIKAQEQGLELDRKELAKFLKYKEERDKFLITKLTKLNEQAADYDADKSGGNIPKTKEYSGSKLTGVQKDYLKDLEATRNQALAVIEKQYTEGQILETEYIEKSLETNLDYFNKKIAYLKSGNAEERKQEAQAQLDKSKAVREANDKLYALNKKRLDDELKQNEDDAQRKRDTVINNPYSTEQEKINAEKTYHSESTTAQLKYNQDMIDLENKLSKSMVEEVNARNRVLQQKLDEENSNNLQSRIDILKADVNDVDKVKEQVDNQNEINAAVAKRNILGDKRLDQQRKENELSLVNAQLVLNNTNAELGAVISKITLYEQEITKRKLTNDELREYNRLLKEKATLEGQKAEGEVNVTNAQGKSKSSGNGVPGSGMSGLANVATKAGAGKDGKFNIAGVDVSEAAGYAIAQGFSIAEQAMNSYFDQERQRIEQSRQLAYQRIDMEREQLMRYAQTNAEREAIDKQAAAKKKKADKEAGEQLKKTKKAEAKIAFLIELANIWSTVWQLGPIAGPIMGGIFTALAGVKYAMTIGNINKTQYKRGGLFGLGGRLDGPSHSNGGMPVINPVTGEKVAEMEGKEGIINANSMADNNTYTITGKPSQIASKINSIGGGVDWFGGATISKFKSGGLFNWNRTQPPVFNSQIQKFEVAEKQSETNDRMDRAERLIEALAKEQSKKVVVSSKEMSKSQKENFKQTEIGTL